MAPPAYHLTIGSDGSLDLSHEPKAHFTRPAADPLLPSVARRYGARAIAVVTGCADFLVPPESPFGRH